MNLEGSQTLKNLARAYATETQDGARYQFLKKMAEKQQQQFIANTLKMFAANEMAHAKVWFDLITAQGTKSVPNVEVKYGFPYNVGSFNETFKTLATVEKEEGEKLYTGFAKTARAEGFLNIAKFFEMTAEVERSHSEVLTKIYNGLTNATLYKSDKEMTWKCVGCGYETKGKTSWKICPLCGAPQGYSMTPALILTESDIKTPASTLASVVKNIQQATQTAKKTVKVKKEKAKPVVAAVKKAVKPVAKKAKTAIKKTIAAH